MTKIRRLNSGSSQFMLCYTAQELYQYKFNKVDGELRLKILDHLPKCDSCLRLYKSLKSEGPLDVQVEDTLFRSREPVKLNLKTVSELPIPISLESGQIWTTSPQPKNSKGEVVNKVQMGSPVVIVSPGSGNRSLDNMIKVVPISCDTDCYLKGESLKLVKNSPLGYPILLEVFNGRLMLAGNLVEFRGDICPSDRKRLCRMHQQYLNKCVKEPDSEYLVWKNNEILLAGYLGYAADKVVPAEETEIELVPYSKAAEDDSVIFEVVPHDRIKSSTYSLVIIQKRDLVLLRNVSKNRLPDAIYLDGQQLKFKKRSGVYEAPLGYVDQMPPSTDIYIIIGYTIYSLPVRFLKGV